MVGETLTIPGVELDGELLPVRARPHKIEVIGDSITSGEGAVGSVMEQDWVSAFFSATNAYPWKLAERLDADVQVFSQSGFGVTCSWDGSDFGALPKYYGQEIIFADAPHDFTEWQPDAVVINLGTNDFGANANPSVFKQGVLDFLKLVRKHNPKAYIVWAVGMAGRPFPVEIQSAIAEIADDNCGYLELPEQNSGTLGSRAHPGELCHEQAAQTLYEHLRSRLGA
jgi:lysophospholipase L1-like esterase